MKTTLRRGIALASTLALLMSVNSASFVANAANIPTLQVNGGTTLAATTTVTTISFTPVTALTNGSTIYISYPASMTDGALVTGNISVANAATDLTAGAAVVNTGTNLITIPVTTVTTGTSPVTLTFAGGNLVGPATGNISFGVSTSVGDAGARVISVANANVVNVTATVVPTLTMALSSTSLALGVLGTAAYSTAATTLTVDTNAVAGATVTAASTGLRDTATNREIGVTDIAAQNQTAATDYYKISTNAAPVFTDANDALANAGGTDVVASQNVYTTAGPVAAAATTVTLGAKVAANTEAGTYADAITFTIAGSF